MPVVPNLNLEPDDVSYFIDQVENVFSNIQLDARQKQDIKLIPTPISVTFEEQIVPTASHVTGTKRIAIGKTSTARSASTYYFQHCLLLDLPLEVLTRIILYLDGESSILYSMHN
jgi:3-deoxy-D-arabino-heptulosonate 7-phosphate (DAHP) synthase